MTPSKNHKRIEFNHSIFLAYAHNFGVAKSWVSKGYEPVECAYGNAGSVVGKYTLDHHGIFSQEEPVSIRAARLAIDRTHLTKFLAAGMPDPDAVYAILTLSHNITPDLEIAGAIAELDVDPIGIDRTQHRYIRNPIFEMLLGSPKRSLDSFIEALKVGILAFDKKDITENILLDALQYEHDRLASAQSEIRSREGDIAFVVSDGLLDTPHFQCAPIIVQYKPSLQKITVRGCTLQSAKRLGIKSVYDVFGHGGLSRVYKKMDELLGNGSGGREDIGGSPNHLNVSESQAIEVFDALKKLESRF